MQAIGFKCRFLTVTCALHRRLGFLISTEVFLGRRSTRLDSTILLQFKMPRSYSLNTIADLTFIPERIRLFNHKGSEGRIELVFL